MYFRLGDIRRAVQYLEEAAQMIDSGPAVFEHLGDAYARDGQDAKAREAWQKALHLDPTLASVQRKLDALPKLSREQHEHTEGASTHATRPEEPAAAGR